MKKELVYREYRFDINVSLNTKVEKTVNGRRYHTMFVNCLSDRQYTQMEVFEDSSLESVISTAEYLAKKYVDEQIDGTADTQKRLQALGFD